MAAAAYPDAIYANIENNINQTQLGEKQRNDVTYTHPGIHQSVGNELVAVEEYLGEKTNPGDVSHPVQYGVINGTSTTTSNWTTEPTFVGLTVNTDLVVDTDTLVVDGTNNRVYIGATSSSFTEKLQVYGSVRLHSGTPYTLYYESDAAVDNRVWKWQVENEKFFGLVSSDAGSDATWLEVNRTANVVDSIRLAAPVLVLDATTAPASEVKLYIADSDSSAQMRIDSTITATTYGVYFGSTTAGGFIGSRTNHTFGIFTNDTERVRIENDGDVFVRGGATFNVSSSGNNRQVILEHDNTNGFIDADSGILYIQSQYGGDLYLGSGTATANVIVNDGAAFFVFNTGNSQSGSISVNAGGRMSFAVSNTGTGFDFDATTPAEWIKFPNISGDPGALENGMMWYNSSSHAFKGRVNGVTRTFTVT